MAKTKVDFVTSSGSRLKRDVLYKFDVNSNCMVPYFSEPYDLYEKIQLSKTQVDLDMIIKRAKAGDTSVLNVNVAHYGDISDLPDNMNDLNALYRSIDSNFKSLPKDIQSLFGSDVQNFGKAVSDGSYQDIINKYFDVMKKNNSKEVNN